MNADCFEDFLAHHSFEDPAAAKFAEKPSPLRGGKVDLGV